MIENSNPISLSNDLLKEAYTTEYGSEVDANDLQGRVVTLADRHEETVAKIQQLGQQVLSPGISTKTRTKVISDLKEFHASISRTTKELSTQKLDVNPVSADRIARIQRICAQVIYQSETVTKQSQASSSSSHVAIAVPQELVIQKALNETDRMVQSAEQPLREEDLSLLEQDMCATAARALGANLLLSEMDQGSDAQIVANIHHLNNNLATLQVRLKETEGPLNVPVLTSLSHARETCLKALFRAEPRGDEGMTFDQAMDGMREIRQFKLQQLESMQMARPSQVDQSRPAPPSIAGLEARLQTIREIHQQIIPTPTSPEDEKSVIALVERYDAMDQIVESIEHDFPDLKDKLMYSEKTTPREMEIRCETVLNRVVNNRLFIEKTILFSEQNAKMIIHSLAPEIEIKDDQQITVSVNSIEENSETHNEGKHVVVVSFEIDGTTIEAVIKPRTAYIDQAVIETFQSLNNAHNVAKSSLRKEEGYPFPTYTIVQPEPGQGWTQCCQNKTQQAGNQIGITKKDDGLKENMVSIPGLQTTVSSEEGYHESTRDLSKNQRFNP